MAWCDSCSAYHDPTESDVCPSCGGVVTASAPLHMPESHGTEMPVETVGQSAPWHFWIVVVALAAYLLWRAVDAVIWLVDKL